MKKPKSIKSLKDKAWKLFSIYIRSKGASFQGYNKCFTCDAIKDWKYELEAGHYIHNKLDFNELNIHPQCTKCNRYLKGNLGVYGERLIRLHGLEVVDALRKESIKKGNNYTYSELLSIIDKYSSKG